MRGHFSMGHAARRCVAGIDLNRRAARVVVASRIWPCREVRIEALEAEPLDPACFAIPGHPDWRAVTRALNLALGRALGSRREDVPGVMALAEAALTCGACECGGHGARKCAGGTEALARAAAERERGVIGESLALDWREDVGSDQIEFVAAPQVEVDARIEVAGNCGIELRVIDHEPAAALRAVRYVADAMVAEQRRVEPQAFHVLWVGDEGAYGWYVSRGRVVARMRMPWAARGNLRDALRGLTGHGPAHGIWLCGEIERLARAKVRSCEVADLLGAPMEVFSLDVLPHRKNLARLKLAPDYAVAFGLALRGVLE